MTIANDHTVLNDADNAGNWTTGGSAAPDSPLLNNSSSTIPIFIDDGDGAAMDFPLKKDANGYTFTSTIPATFDSSTGGVVVWWILYLADVTAIPINYLAVRLSSSTGFTTNFEEWKFIDATGGDSQDPELLEGWTPTRVYPDTTTADGDNSNGTLNTASLESVGIVIVAGSTADGKFGGFDKVLYITEMQMHSSTTEGLDELFDDATNGSRPNRLGVVSRSGNFFEFNVNIRLGDASATGITTFSETGRTLFFNNVESTHELGFIFENHATHDNNFVITDCSVFWNDQPSTAEIWSSVTIADDFQVVGCSFVNGGQITLPADAVDRYVRNTKFDNCQAGTFSDGEFTTCTVSNNEAITVTGDADLTGSSILTPGVAIDAAGLIWNGNFDPDGNLDNMVFTKGTTAHHAIEFGTASPLTMTLRGIAFGTSWNASNSQNDSTLNILRTSGTVTINLVDCTGNISYKSAGATVVLVVSPVTVTVNVKDNAGANLQNARVFLETAATQASGEIFEAAVTSITRSGSTATCTTTAVHGLETNDYVVIRGAQPDDYNRVAQVTVTSTTIFTYTVTGTPSTPATGTPLVSYVAISALTNVSGNAAVTRSFGADQAYKGWARLKNTSSPFYKEANIATTVSSSNDTPINLVLLPDE